MTVPKQILYSVTALIGLFCCSPSFAGKFGRTLDIGSPAPTWKHLPGIDGKQHSLEDLKASDVVVVVFTCNSCPYASDYEDRIVAFAGKFCQPAVDAKGTSQGELSSVLTDKKQSAARVALVAINVNQVKEDLPPAMAKRAEEKKFSFPYLFDESQQIARDFGAIWTPEFFVLNKERKVVYMGAFDDNTDASKVKRHYVEEAVTATLNGKAMETAETPAIGCQIRWERRRRSRRKSNK